MESGFLFFFFFSSRRRHTRLQGDWSSDMCSSDLLVRLTLTCLPLRRPIPRLGGVDQLLRTEEDAVFDDLDLDRIALLEPGRGADLGRKGDDATLGELRASHSAI